MCARVQIVYECGHRAGEIFGFLAWNKECAIFVCKMLARPFLAKSGPSQKRLLLTQSGH